MSRSLCVLALAAALTACSKKAPEPAPEPEPVAAPAPAPEPEEEVVEAPPPEPEEAPMNADFDVAITWADGTSTSGHVVRVERSEDWYAEEGWTTAPAKTTVTLEGNGTEVEKTWEEIQSITISYGGKSDMDCQFDSSFTPVMYMCVLRTDGTAKTADGKTWSPAGRHKWRFTLDSGEQVEFWVNKLPARQQEEEVPSLGTVEENTELYVVLQAELMELKGGKVPTKITVTP